MKKRNATLIGETMLAEGVPIDQILRLLGQWGGLPLSIPRTASRDHAIARAAGFEAMQSLCRNYPGERLTMPLGRALRRELLRREVVGLLAAGLNRAQIARQLGLHLRQVYRLGNSAPHIDIPGAQAVPSREQNPQIEMENVWNV